MTIGQKLDSKIKAVKDFFIGVRTSIVNFEKAVIISIGSAIVKAGEAIISIAK